VPKIERRPISEKTATMPTAANKQPPKWLALVSELEALSTDSVLALTPDDGDSMRALKVQVSRAANRAGRKEDILYAQNANGELEVWIREKPKQVRGPRKPKE
jgi:hypothetical protein